MAERTPLISGNWKMNHNHLDALALVQKLSYHLGGHNYDKVEVSVHPPFTDLRTVQTAIESDRMKFSLGAQNCYFEESGAFTGEVSALFLAKLNVKYVIVGHSERRADNGETDRALGSVGLFTRGDRRRREPQGQGRVQGADDADHVLRRDARGA